MRATVPGRSALTVTPCTATAVPITFKVADQVSCLATTVVTAVGGGWKLPPFAIAVCICLNFTKPRLVINSPATASIRTIRFATTTPCSSCNYILKKRDCEEKTPQPLLISNPVPRAQTPRGVSGAPRKTSLGDKQAALWQLLPQPPAALNKYQIFPTEQRIQSIPRVP